MPEAAPVEFAGKAKRVVGMFVSMLGSGILLESSAFWIGTVIMLAGMATFIRGLAEARQQASLTAAEQKSYPAAAVHPTESNL